MKSVLALSALLFARAVFAQDSLSATTTTPAAAGTDSVVAATDSASASTTSGSISASITGSASSASTTATKSKSGSSSAAAAAATGASYTVPSGISSDCSAFLTSLNTDTTLGTCTTSLLKATTGFSTGSQSQSSLVSALNNLCSGSGCSDKYIRTQLTNFASACSDELDPSSGTKSVRDTYDLLYVMQPFQDAICQKNEDGTYCALEAPSSTSNSTSSGSSDKTGASVNAVVSGTDADAVDAAIAKFYGKSTSSSGSLKKRAQTVIDTATYRSSGVMYLYTLPTLSAASLCTDCVQKILASYAKWESTVPYATGLSNSPMLGGQGELWTVAKAKCGTGFLNTVTASAGTDNAETNAGSQVGVSSAVAGAFAVAMGFWVAL